MGRQFGRPSGCVLIRQVFDEPGAGLHGQQGVVGVGGADGLLTFVDVAASPATVSSGLAVAASNSLTEGPIVDGTNHTVFTFTSDDSGTTGALASAAVVQANVQSSAPAQLARQGIGKKGNSNIRAGAFTDAYFTTASTGYL